MQWYKILISVAHQEIFWQDNDDTSCYHTLYILPKLTIYWHRTEVPFIIIINIVYMHIDRLTHPNM